MLNLIGLGCTRMRPMGFMILQVQVSEIAGYDEDVIFLVVADESDFSRHMPLVVWMCTLGRIINVIKESEIDRLSTPWAIARTSSLLNRCGMAVSSADGMGSALAEGAMASEDSVDQEIDESALMRESMKLKPFQMEILEEKTNPLLGESTQVMVAPMKAGEAQQSGTRPLPPGLHVFHMYMRLKMGSNKVSVVVWNMSDSPIYLKKGMQIACIVSAVPVPPAKLSAKMEATLGAEVQQELMSISMHQERLLEKLNLDGIGNWSPRNAAAVEKLILAFHAYLHWIIMGAIEHEIHINDSEPFKKWFRCIPLPLLEEAHASLHDMLDAGLYTPISPHGATQWFSFAKVWDSMLLHRFPPPEHADQEKFIPIAMYPGSSQEYGRCCALLHNGF